MTVLTDLKEDAGKAWKRKYSSYSGDGYGSLKEYELTDIMATPDANDIQAYSKVLASAVQIIENDTSLEQTQTITFREKTIDTFETTVTHGFKSSLGITSTSKFSVNLWLVGSAEQSIEVALNLEYDYSSTTTESHSIEKEWTLEQPVRCPPRSKVECTLLILSADYEIPINLRATINGDMDYKDRPGVLYTEGYTLWNPWDGDQYFTGYIYPSDLATYLSSNDVYTKVPGSNSTSVIWNGKAKTVASQSLKATVQMREIPLSYPGETRTYYLPVECKVVQS